MTSAKIILVFLIVCLGASAVLADDRFPEPEFDSGYSLPKTQRPLPESLFRTVLDLAVLAAALAVAAWLVHWRRSRKGLLMLSVFCLVYFGFLREGCVCSIGALQNAAAALFQDGAALPLAVFLFLALPLAAALLFGRTFCAAVCPLGAIQELVILRPLRLPRPLARALELLPAVYLSAALLFAALGGGFLICRFDPFVALFRRSGSATMLAAGAVLLLAGTLLARPYCRFLCPLGLILGWASAVSRWQVKITPDHCITCRLCEDVCPVDAISVPQPPGTPASGRERTRRLALTLALLPVVALLCAWIGAALGPVLAKAHPVVALADRLDAEVKGRETQSTDETDAFRGTGTPTKKLYLRAEGLEEDFRTGGLVAGLFLGLLVSLRLAAALRVRPQEGAEPDPAACVSCGRCFDACPRENLRRQGGSLEG